MWNSHLRNPFARYSPSSRGHERRAGQRRRIRPALEVLEDRTVPTTFAVGDVFVGTFAPVGDMHDEVKWYHPDSTFVQTLDPLRGPGQLGVAGMAFDKDGNLYAADFETRAVSKFSNTGVLTGTFGGGYGGGPISIVFDAFGNSFVAQANGNIREFG